MDKSSAKAVSVVGPNPVDTTIASDESVVPVVSVVGSNPIDTTVTEDSNEDVGGESS